MYVASLKIKVKNVYNQNQSKNLVSANSCTMSVN